MSKSVGFLMIPIYTHYLTPDDYGVLELLDLIVTVLGLLVGMGLGSAIFRFYYHYEKLKDKYEVVTTALLFVILMTVFIVLPCLIFADKISLVVFGSDQYSYYFQLMFISFFFTCIGTVPECFLRAEQRSALFTTITLITLILNVGLNIYFVAVLKMRIIGILYASVIMRFLNNTFLLILNISKTKLSFSIVKLREMLKYGIPLFPASFGFFILNFADRFILKHFGTLEVVGIYSLGYKFAFMISLLIINPFTLIWQAQMFEIAKKPEAKEIFSKFLTYFSLVVITSAFVLSVFINDVIGIIAPPDFYSAYKVVPIIALGYVFYGFYHFFQIGILLEKKTKFLGFAVFIGAFANIILNLLLVPSYEAIGAALATVFSFLIMSLCTFVFSQRLYRIKYEFGRIVKILCVASLLLIFSLFLNVNSFFINICIKMTIIILFFVILFSIRFFTDEELRKIRFFFKIVVNKFRLLSVS
ncbi:MAG: oligosaccharide flippase family protein [Ignavibacteriales bacterium]|nr:oligosaccharide flippase family protein [Ignavibacteriales bacterium]